MSTSTRYTLQRLALVTALVACACLLGASVVLAQVDGGTGGGVPGVPGGQVTITGGLLSAILYLARRLEQRPTSETLTRAYNEIDEHKAEVRRLRDALDAERLARLTAEYGRPTPGAGGAP